jgi:ferredoxin, 2Fe-2S
MPLIHVTNRSGVSSVVDAASGQSVMDMLRARGDVEGLCGGNCSCATCHVHLDKAWHDRLGDPSAEEQTLLDYSMEKRPTSRLSCQIDVVDALDGLKLTVAAAEG